MPNKKNFDHIDSFLYGVSDITKKISREDINGFINQLFQAWFHKRKIVICGNGGSSSTASHFTADLNNCLSNIEGAHRLSVICLNDNMARFSALVNDKGWENVYTEQLKNYFEPGDVIIGISVHGGSGKDKAGAWSQNLLKALQFAKDNGGKTLGMAGFDGGSMKKICDVCIVVPYNTTPHVEGYHVLLHHMIYDLLPKKISIFINAANESIK